MGKQKTLSFGPPKGVRNTTEPYDDAASGDFCTDALNVYFRDPSGLVGAQERPSSHQIGSGWGISLTTYPHALHTNEETGLTFLITNGKVYRLNPVDYSAALTDVTPVGITLSNFNNPVGIVDVGTSIVVQAAPQGARPWVGTNLSATPITGTYIDIDGAGGAWISGAPTVYQGSVVFPTITVPNGSAVQAGVGIVWSEPNQPTVGYAQSGYANYANEIEHNASAINVVWGTNIGLYYFRETSIGFLSGPLFTFTTAATSDAVSSSTGCHCAAGMQQYQNTIFFSDTLGRPQMLPLGGKPAPIWKQLAAVVQGLRAGSLQTTEAYLLANTHSAIVPELDLYAVVSWPSASVNGAPDSTVYAFDAQSGTYVGEWRWKTNDAIGCMANINQPTGSNATGQRLFATLGHSTAGVPDVGCRMTYLEQIAESNTTCWGYDYFDSPGVVSAFSVQVQTQRLGYEADTVYMIDRATVITTADIPITVTTLDSFSDTASVFATPNAPASPSDAVVRTTVGLDLRSTRYVQATISPTPQGNTNTHQWSFQRIEMPAVASKAGPEDY